MCNILKYFATDIIIKKQQQMKLRKENEVGLFLKPRV